MEDTHSFENTVVAVLEKGDRAREAVDRLTAEGLEVELLEGEAGSAHLDPGAEGFWASVKKTASALGDERLVLERLESELSKGSVVISVALGDRDGKEAVSILREYESEYLWKFGDWTFTPIEV